MQVKRYLEEVLNAVLEPIRQRRHVYEQDLGQVYQILQKGSQVANEVAEQTLAEVRAAIGVNYFEQ